MKTIFAEKRTRNSLKWKLQPATEYSTSPGYLVCAFWKSSQKWKRQFAVTKTTLKIIAITHRTLANESNIIYILTISPYVNNPDLNH